MTRALQALGLAALLGACSTEATTPSERPNVVLIVIDTLRPDHLGFGGYERETAPFLASLARKGTVFENAFSTSSWTAPSTASVFTGLYPPRHGVVQGFFAHFHGERSDEADVPEQLSLTQLPKRYSTLPELFARNDYRTYGLTTNINIGPEIGFDRGFDQFERLDNVPSRKVLERLESWKPELLAKDGQPYFLYLHFNDVHTPYRPRKRWYVESEDLREQRISAYDSEISYLDGFLRQLHTDYQLDDDTLIAIVSDHGEEFLDHGNWFHGFSLHRELNQVLMMIHAPGLDVPSQRVPVNVSLVDVLPTLVELAQLDQEARSDAARNGRSLVELLAPAAEREAALARFDARPLFAHRELRSEAGVEHTWAVMRSGWRLLEIGGERRLYDLWRDRAERQDLAAQEPKILRELGELLDEMKARGIDEHGTQTSVDLDSEMLERLGKLGYAE